MAFEQRSLDDYIDVAQRIADFREKHPNGSLRGDFRMIQIGDQHLIAYRAETFRDSLDPAPGIGCAWELVPGRTPFTKGSELQNAETSAWGRAIIAAGASDSKRGIASREEVRNRQAERDDGLPVNKDGSVSRSRTTDEQKAAAGVPTDAQQKELNRQAKAPANSQPVERLSTTPPGDPWMDGPAGLSPQDDPEDRPGTCTPEQIGSLKGLYGQLGISDRKTQLEVTAQTLKMDVLPTHTRLSYRQAGDLIVALRAEAKAAK